MEPRTHNNSQQQTDTIDLSTQLQSIDETLNEYHGAGSFSDDLSTMHNIHNNFTDNTFTLVEQTLPSHNDNKDNNIPLVSLTSTLFPPHPITTTTTSNRTTLTSIKEMNIFDQNPSTDECIITNSMTIPTTSDDTSDTDSNSEDDGTIRGRQHYLAKTIYEHFHPQSIPPLLTSLQLRPNHPKPADSSPDSGC